MLFRNTPSYSLIFGYLRLSRSLLKTASHAPVILPISSIITLVCGIVLCDIPCRLSMTSSLRRFFGAA